MGWGSGSAPGSGRTGSLMVTDRLLMIAPMPRAKKLPIRVTIKASTLRKWMMQPITNPKAMPISSISGMTTAGLIPFCSSTAEATEVSARTEATERSMPFEQDHKGHADRDDQQAGIVDKQVEEHLRFLHGRVDLPGDEVAHEKDGDGDQQRAVVQQERFDPLP